MLGDCAHILRAVGEALQDRASDYGAVFAAALAMVGEPGLAPRRPDKPAAKDKPIDDEWVDEPVIFGPAGAAGCGVAATPDRRDAVHAPPSHDAIKERLRCPISISSCSESIPYICLAVFFVGSLVRFDRDQYTWKSDSSQLLQAGQLRWGSNLFHIGILGIFFGHLVGLLTPLVGLACARPHAAPRSRCWRWSPAARPGRCASSA